MDRDTFWGLIDAGRAAAHDPADGDAVAEALLPLLVAAGPDVARGFDRVWREEDARAYGWPLWGAAYLVMGGCGDDSFDDVRGWLFSRGRAVFDAAVADPDSLADYVEPGDDLRSELMTYVATQAVEATGADGADRAARPDLGDDWDFDDDEQMRRRYPRLWAKVTAED